MKPRDWFILILRGFGIYEFTSFLHQVISIFNVVLHFARLERTQLEAYIGHAVLSFALSLWLLKSAPNIANFFYHDSTDQRDDTKH